MPVVKSTDDLFDDAFVVVSEFDGFLLNPFWGKTLGCYNV